MPNKPYPNRLKFFRIKLKLTQQRVADYLDHASANRLSTWENGTATPSIQNLIKLAKLYNTSIDKLVAPLKQKMRKVKQRGSVSNPMRQSGPREPDTDILLNELSELIIEAYFVQKEENKKRPKSYT
ncbi:MAG: helix-turn-helix transcriptional regulator [Candidatus Paceibacterota bacterium]